MANPYEHTEKRIREKVDQTVHSKAEKVLSAAYAYTAEVKTVADEAYATANTAYAYAVPDHYHLVTVTTPPGTYGTSERIYF